MHRAVVSAQEVEKIVALPENLKRYKNLELLINPVYPYNKNKLEMKKKLDAIFKKARSIKIPADIDIDEMMNEMNDALL